MSRLRTTSVSFFGVLAVLLSGCGGGGQGLRVESNPVRVTSTALPPLLSGDALSHVIPLEGGCGGPYVLQVIRGALPRGIQLANETHSIEGFLLADGEFEFTVQLTDTGCTPFSTTTATFTMSVGVGEIRVVSVRKDGEQSDLIPPGEGVNPADPAADPYNPDHPALPETIFNEFTLVDLVIAGGKGPYEVELYDDPDVDDGPLPLGTSILANSTSVAGTPIEEAPDGAFLVTLQITDALGTKGYFTTYWLVYSPPLLLASTDFADGVCGQAYSHNVFLAGGIPPFAHELVEAEGSETRITSAIYPAPGDMGPDYASSHFGAPPEGIFIEDDGGVIRGIPRRRGDFAIVYHGSSTLLPFSPLQNVWGTFEFSFVPAAPLGQDPAYTLDGASFPQAPPYAKIAEAEQKVTYNPDVARHPPEGLQLLANGGVPQDGYTDAPHESQVDVDPAETAEAYLWSVDWNPDGEGSAPIAHMELLPSGIFRVVPDEEDLLIPQFDQVLGFTAQDFALPAPLADRQEQKVRFAIGPDRILISESSTSFSSASSYDNREMNDTKLTLQMVIPRSTGATEKGDVALDDLTGEGDDKIKLPPEANLDDEDTGDLFKQIDILRVAVNPTGWWDDTNHLNPKAARPFQHGDRNAVYSYEGGLANAGTSYYNGSSYSSYRYQLQPTATCVRLPACSSDDVTQDKAKGVYTDGGKLYVFDASDHFGLFVVRKDGRIYVPAAFDKSYTGWQSFGDNWTEGHKNPGSSNSINKIPQMTVSPDGRFAAFKLRSSTSYSRTEYADDTAILIVSLTGERIDAWDGTPGDGEGEVYVVIDTGSDGSSSQGQYQFASSLTLTNDYLYYLVGSGSTTYLSWKDHYIYRYDLFGGDDEGSFLHPSFNKEWTNTTGSAMQTPFQMFSRDFDKYSGPEPLMVSAHGYNAYESSLAPHPFRVNAGGHACAIVAGRASDSTYRSYDIRWYHVWVDYEGELHQVSSQRRHACGGGRGINLTSGPMYDPVSAQWGGYDGPTSRLEISDDGLKVAVVYTRFGSSSSQYPYASAGYSTYVYRYRQDIVVHTTTVASEWDSVTTHEVTGDSSTSTSPSGAVFQGAIAWRFGALTFTAEGDGLVFWGGYSNYEPAAYYMSSYYSYRYMGNTAKSFVGSLYSYAFSNGAIRNVLSSSDGGCNKTVGTTLTSISFSTSSWQTDGGMIKPIGGFLSANREFMYVVTRGAVTSSSKVDGEIIAVNIRNLDSGQSINGRTNGRAYRPSGLDAKCGFYPVQYYYATFGIGHAYYSDLYHQLYCFMGDSQRAAATDTGWIYFVSEKSTYNWTSSYNSYYSGGAVHQTYYTYTYLTKHLYLFDPNVGGDVVQIAGDSWGGSNSYHVVNYLEVSDDGSAVAAVDGTYYHNWWAQERLTVWRGIELDADTGDLVAGTTPTKTSFETGGRVSSCITFTPQVDKILYAHGTSNENQKTLRTGELSSGTKVDWSTLGTSHYNVLHAGR